MTEGYEAVVAGVSLVRPDLNGPVIDWAADAAVARGLDLHIVHAQEWPRGTSPDAGPEHRAHVWSRHFRAGGEAVLEAARGRAWARDRVPAVTTELAAGRPVQVLREAGEDAALMVLGARRLAGVEGAFAGRGKGHALLGHVPCAVALVPEPDPAAVSGAPVVVGIDGSASSLAAAALAFTEAQEAGTGLVAVAVRRPRDYAWAEYREDTLGRLSEQMAELGGRFPDVAVRQEVLTGEPALMLASAARHARCLVVGSRGRGGFRGALLGSTSRALVHHTHCPLIVAPPLADT